AIPHRARAEQVEVERRPILSDLVPDEAHQLGEHPFDQRGVVFAVVRMAAVLQLAWVLLQIMERHVTAGIEVVEAGGEIVILWTEPAHELVSPVDDGPEEAAPRKVRGAVSAPALLELRVPSALGPVRPGR